MDPRRTLLQTLLKTVIETPETKKDIWFQAPPAEKLVYPCIIYKLEDVDTVHADNKPYSQRKRYQVMVIDRNPDSPIPDRVGRLPLSDFSRFYTADNLNHFVYTLYF